MTFNWPLFIATAAGGCPILIRGPDVPFVPGATETCGDMPEVRDALATLDQYLETFGLTT